MTRYESSARRRLLAFVVAAASGLALLACGSSGRTTTATTTASSTARPPSSAAATADLSTPAAAAKAYADAFLHGTAADYVALQSPSCAKPLSDTSLIHLRSTLETFLKSPVSNVVVTGAEVRNQAGNRAEAQATFNTSSIVLGNDNWIWFTDESGKWLAADCQRLPVGGVSDAASGSAPGPAPASS